jgi:mono/diheme cytochrome c family protein
MTRVNILLLAALGIVTAANLVMREDPAKPNREFLPEMVRTAAYDSFAPNPNFADGKTLQTPVPGTVPREERLGPVPAGRGQFVYTTFCQPCHGGSGNGDGPVARRGFPPPPSLLAPQAKALAEEEIFRIVSAGRKNMPGYAAQIAPEDRRAVIAYVRSMQKGNQP